MKNITISVLSAMVLTGLISCGSEKKEAETNAIDESAVAVHLTEVKQSEFTMPVVSSGLITTTTESKLSFKTGGIITKILVEEGQSVVRGQLLATLDQTEIDAQVSQAKNNLDKTRRDLERVGRLYKDSAATLEQMQNVQTGYDLANESWRIASFNKQYSTIHATTSGMIIRKLVNEGELVSGGTTVLQINSASENNWIVKIGLPDVDWVRIRKGDKAVIRTDAYSNETFEGVVSLINEGSDVVSGLYSVEVKVNPRNRKLASGLVASIQILPSEKQKLRSIPVESIVEGSGANAFVFVASDDRKTVKKIPVRIAGLSGNEVLISDGLEGVNNVVTAGSAFLTEFSTITVLAN